MKKLFDFFKNNPFVESFRDLPETDKISFKELKNNFKMNYLFRRLPEEDPDFATDVRETILAQTPQGGRLIIWATLILLVIFIVWASFSELEEVTRGEGKVVPSSHVQIVQNLEGGIISEILINVGDKVKKDQLLLKMDPTRFSSSFEENRVKYLSDKAKAARLKAEATGSALVIPEDVLKERPDIAERERQLFQTRRMELGSSSEIKRQQINQRRQELKELEAKLVELNRTYSLLQKEIGMIKPLVNKGAASDVEVLQLERQASQLEGEIDRVRHAIPAAQAKLQESEVALRELSLSYRSKSSTESSEVLKELDESASSSLALKDRLDRTAVRSPVDGIVNRVMVKTVGGVVQPGMDLVEIVPMHGNLLIEAKIKPSDIAFLRPGQKATIKFTAYDYTVYGALDAELESVGADSITDDKGNSYFLVRLRTDKNYLGTAQHPLPIMPGMVTTVDILTGKKTVLSYILKPVLKARYMALRER
ncbi:MAG TPA: HlyD family type I secretion periplasmic adaptor subunit [Smithella sp.]|nr:HlyD family type I secretion periplasmic adaptor subunit [Smithella sp.]HQI23757.1 HlyD family type I secretion periplasmic adaptor subunit [Smithella sp.]HQL97034.1 HlyD family type I secretion periplasmic adaptor subunit [Smithella sp.]